MRRKTLALLGGGLLTAVAAVAPAAPAAAAVTTCDASAAAIYAAPGVVTGAPGTVLACRPVDLPEVPATVAVNAWQVRYVSSDVQGNPVAVAGTVAVPATAWTGPGTRPVVSFHFGTLGLGPQCAFSKQLAGAYQDEYEGDQFAALLDAGWAVAATDDMGYLDGQVHTYMVGRNMGHATLDAARAALRLPGSGLSTTTKVGLWGYSQGGAAALWAAQLAASYAPDLNVAAAAAGGVPADLKAVGQAADGGPFAGFSADATIGLNVAYPNLPYDSLLNTQGKATVAALKTVCLTGTIAVGAGKKTVDSTVDHLTLDQLYQVRGSDGVSWGDVLDAQKLGVGVGPKTSTARYRIGFPVLQYHGLLDEVIPTAVEDAVHTAYCQAGVTTQQSLYLADHLLTDSGATDDVTSWFTARFAGTATTGNC